MIDGLTKLVGKLFSKKGSNDHDLVEACFVSKPFDTQLDEIVYLRGNKTCVLDLNSIVTMSWVKNERHCTEILEPEDADIVKKSIARYFEKRNEPFPEQFGFLKVYSQQQKKKALFDLKG